MDIEKLQKIKGSELSLTEYYLAKINHDINVIKWILLIPIILSILGGLIMLTIYLIVLIS